eukprot:999873-Amphidinium_carterae.1
MEDMIRREAQGDPNQNSGGPGGVPNPSRYKKAKGKESPSAPGASSTTEVPKQRAAWQKLGVAQPQTMLLGAFTGQGAGVSSRSHRHQDLLTLIHEAAAMRTDQSPYSSVMVSQGLRALPHRDCRNEGLNHLLVLGDYVGGELWVQSDDGAHFMEVEGECVPAKDVSKHGGWVSFDAAQYHEVRPFEGMRLSVALFMCKGLYRLQKEDWQQLGILGFDVKALQR